MGIGEEKVKTAWRPMVGEVWGVEWGWIRVKKEKSFEIEMEIEIEISQLSDQS